jgi:hypothetical protein
MSNIVNTRGEYIIEVTVPHYVNKKLVGHKTHIVASYTGERWRAKHHAQTHWKREFPEGTVNVRWVGPAPDDEV